MRRAHRIQPLLACLLLAAATGCSGGGGGSGSSGGGGPAPASFVGNWSGTFEDDATGKRHGFLLAITSEGVADSTGAQALEGTMSPLGLDGLTQAPVSGLRHGPRVDLSSPPGPWNLTFDFIAETALADGSFTFVQTFGARQTLTGALRTQFLTGNERLLGTWNGTWRSLLRAPSQGTILWLVSGQSPAPQPDPQRPDLLNGRMSLEGFPEIQPTVFGLQSQGLVTVDQVEEVEAVFPGIVFRFAGQVHLGLLEGRYELHLAVPNTLLDEGTLQADLQP